jgi:CheY-like chemotaxis protein
MFPARCRLPHFSHTTSKVSQLPPTILIAEDEFIIRLTIAEFLRDEGYDVIETANADEALDVFRAGIAVNLLFTDVRMPGSMDGCALAQKVRAEWPATPVVLTSAFSEALLSARSVSQDFVVPKPYRPQAVLATIKALLGAAGASA